MIRKCARGIRRAAAECAVGVKLSREAWGSGWAAVMVLMGGVEVMEDHGVFSAEWRVGR